MLTTRPNQIRLSQVMPHDRLISLTKQVFVVIDVNLTAKWIRVKALTAPSGPGSARAQPKDTERYVVNGHQWLSRMTRYEGPIGAQEPK